MTGAAPTNTTEVKLAFLRLMHEYRQVVDILPPANADRIGRAIVEVLDAMGVERMSEPDGSVAHTARRCDNVHDFLDAVQRRASR